MKFNCSSKLLKQFEGQFYDCGSSRGAEGAGFIFSFFGSIGLVHFCSRLLAPIFFALDFLWASLS